MFLNKMENLTIEKCRELLKSKKISAAELTENFISKIEKSDGKIGAFLATNFENARAAAKKFDENFDEKIYEKKPLAGIPVAIKDSLCTANLTTTAGSKILENFVPPFSATAVEKLENAGAIILGKTNCDEFTMGSSTENSAFKITKNPHDETRVPGGSSGGSAAAVAADFCVASLGTDTGGSIRQPANFCGVCGIKPTFGRVSRFGAISYASSFDTVGPLAKTVADAAEILQIIAGRDLRDATTADLPMDSLSPEISRGITEKNCRGKKIGVLKQFSGDGIDPKILENFQKTTKNFAKNFGCEILEIDFPVAEFLIPTYYLLVKSEASTNLSRYDGVKFGGKIDGENLTEFYEKTRGALLGDEPKRAIMMGTFALSSGFFDAYFQKAAAVRAKIIFEFEKIWEKCDAVFAPVSPFLPFKIGEKKDDPLQMYLADIFTVLANLIGAPAVATPTGKIGNLPTGLQILGRQFAEKEILNFAAGVEKFCKK
jgi:aspartyl-tRNA(Asn)/glutamyl-tRNA(Gln) amidotransferase subunit A